MMEKLHERVKQSSRLTLWTLVGGLLFVIIFIFGISNFVLADDGETTAEQRLVTIHDAGSTKTILTTATTVADAIKEANINIEDNDTVEPSRNAELITSSFTVNIYRAKPIVVVDDRRAVRVISSSQTGRTIAYDAGVELFPEDLAIISNARNILQNGGAGQVVTIKRAFEITLVLYGYERQVRTQAGTVEEFLREKRLQLNPADTMNLGMGSRLSYGMTLKIWREGINTITVDEEIPYITEFVQDADRPIGFREVRERGAPGKRSVTYEIVVHGGIEISRKEINSLTLLEPRRQVEVIGVRSPVPSNPGANAELGHRMMLEYGFPESEWPCLYQLWMHESGWVATKANYAGSGAYGIPQALPASKMATAGPDYLTNPATQIRWGLGYIAGRYGTPCNAWAFFQAHRWY